MAETSFKSHSAVKQEIQKGEKPLKAFISTHAHNYLIRHLSPQQEREGKILKSKLLKSNLFKQSLPYTYKKQSANKITKNSLLIYSPAVSMHYKGRNY